MPRSRIAALEFALRWQSPVARHTERVYFEKLNFWRDFFPGRLADRLGALAVGAVARESYPAGELVGAWSASAVHRVRPDRIKLKLRSGEELVPHAGRFYPRGMVEGLPDVFAGDRRPLRYLGESAGQALVDLNHPLARFPLAVEARLAADLGIADEHGGRSQDVPQELCNNGPGMQVPHPDVATDFYVLAPYARLDERADRLFYLQPRRVQHLDAQVRGQITELYARRLRPGMRVLDLMSSWVSHLPEMDLEVTGLGLNAEELAQNPRLSGRTLHDLNEEPRLPYPDGHFDAVVCTASVEYLTRPLEVFREVRRVLRPGAPFVLTFSERWFPPKVIGVWPMLHPFERLGLVLDYLLRSGGYAALATESARGWPRPADDAYASQFAEADPLYAVWGEAA
jgi:SAM-dependent methyltransferase